MADKDEIKRLRIMKGQCKRTITLQENFLEKHAGSLTVEGLEVRLQAITDALTKYQEYQVQLLLHDETVEDDDLEERVIVLQTKIRQYIKTLIKKEPDGSSTKTESYSAKLPALDIPIFDGKNITSYKPFMEMFEAMVDVDERIPKIQKLCFLKKYLKGEPLQLIDSLPIIGDSYNAAIKLLHKRYENPALLINNHVATLLDLPTLPKGTAAQLRDFVAKVRQHITALKNLNQPINQWNAILSTILIRKIDPYTSRLYHTDRDNTQIPTVDSILDFLDKRAASLEASPSPATTVNEKYKNKISVSLGAVKSCSLCPEGHKLHKCPKFISMTPRDRFKYVENNILCRICLSAHAKKCRYSFKCGECSGNHNTLIHQDLHVQKENCPTSAALHSIHTNTAVILPTAKVLVSDIHGTKFLIKVLLDSASQMSFCTTALAKKLRLPTFQMHKNIVALGGSQNKCTGGVNLCIFSRVQNYKINVTCSLIDNITTKLPQRQINLDKFSLPKGIVLADDEFNIPGEISMLLAADIFFKIIQDGKVEGDLGDPILINTRLGYIVSACNNSTSKHNTVLAMHTVLASNPTHNLDKQVKQFWEAEKVPEVYLEAVPEHEYSMKVFQESVTLQNNTFRVKMPLKIALQDIDPSNSYFIALQRLHNLQKKFTKNSTYCQLYKDFIQEYIDLGHAKIINTQSCNALDQPLYFLPHHAVLRLDKQTNKLRVVMDGSAKTKNGHSLNDILCNGPVLQKTLFEIIILFRTFKYTIQCDIRHMYRNIYIHPEHRCLQNILWNNNGVIQCLQLQTVTYGLTSSAFLATACLFELAKKYQSEFPLASEAIFKCSYIDDIQAGCDTLHEAILLKNQLQGLMQKGGFSLHKYASNESQLLKDIPKEKISHGEKEIDQDKSIHKILGLSYDAVTDVFKVSGRKLSAPTEIPTKRSVLSSISRFFDPMGFVGPVTVKAKLFLQQIWQNNLDWDTPLPKDLIEIWEEFYLNLINMPEISIKRYIQTAEAEEVELIGFCDASSSAYGCCIFIKIKINGIVYMHLLCSKSKVASLNSKLTIPKLELNGAVLLAKLIYHVCSILNITKVSLFCDSKIVLGWLGLSTVKVPAYIANRIKEINKLTRSMSWFYIPGFINPADVLSRGCDPLELSQNRLWRQGPDCICESDSYNFYMSEIEKPIDDYQLLTSNITENIVCVNTEKTMLPILENFSSLFKATRIMTLVLKFIKKCRKESVNNGRFSVEELREAMTYIVKGVQNYYFTEEIKAIKENKEYKSILNSLTPFLDSEGVLRVGGRLHNANLGFSQKFPIILPKHCHVTRLIITQEHIKLMHGGLKIVLSSLTQKYYIINSIREIKSVIHKCIVCCRHRANVAQQLMGSLPSDRVNPARAFEKVGMDYGGPFEIKQSSKRNSITSKGYVAVFVCFTTKAVHLEVVTDMSTDTFLAALKRFIARRGNPSDIFCDNATTFKGANNKLNQLYELHKTEDFQNSVNNFALQKGIQFHFIPKYSPNHGGLWEAAVKSAKHHLKRVSSFKIFTYEQFSTIIIEIESILNSRPLTPMSQDVSDFTVLTPGHFLIGCALTAIPQPNLTDVPSNRLRFWRCCEQVRQNFWKVWSNDYLSSLNKRTKWQKDLPNLKIGLLVLLKNSNTPALHWPMGRISRVFPGKDDKVRVVEVQTSDKKLHCRALTKIVILPIET